MHSLDAPLLVKASLAGLFATGEQTVEQHETDREHREGRQNDEFDRVVISIGDLLAVPEGPVIGSMLEHLLEEVLMRRVEVEVERGTLSEHDEILFFR